MMICTECGHVFNDDEAFVVEETLDMIDGVAYRERSCVCPECNGEYEQAVQCAECGEWFRWDDLVSGRYCQRCMDDLMRDVSLLKAFAKETPDEYADFVYETKNAPQP